MSTTDLGSEVKITKHRNAIGKSCLIYPENNVHSAQWTAVKVDYLLRHLEYTGEKRAYPLYTGEQPRLQRSTSIRTHQNEGGNIDKMASRLAVVGTFAVLLWVSEHNNILQWS